MDFVIERLRLYKFKGCAKNIYVLVNVLYIGVYLFISLFDMCREVWKCVEGVEKDVEKIHTFLL
ncbi:hypothetical protein BANORC5_32840 [Bacteroides nordii]|nr:hypothetical protein BANORC5_32840 [Bacteroides nordii]